MEHRWGMPKQAEIRSPAYSWIQWNSCEDRPASLPPHQHSCKTAACKRCAAAAAAEAACCFCDTPGWGVVISRATGRALLPRNNGSGIECEGHAEAVGARRERKHALQGNNGAREHVRRRSSSLMDGHLP